MQSLFDDTKNPVFRLVCQIVKEIRAGAKLTRKEILARIFSLPEFIYVEAPEVEREENIVDTLFIIETADPLQFYPRLWKFQAWAEILSGADKLRERIKNDAEEALKNYAEFV